MHPLLRLVALAFVFVLATLGWMVLGTVTHQRTISQDTSLVGQVHDLWGAPQAQQAPSLTFQWTETLPTDQPVRDDQGRAILDTRGEVVRKVEVVQHDEPMRPASTDLDVGLRLDRRRKGLMWYDLYDVDLAGTWTYTHQEAVPGWLAFSFAFPVSNGSYDGFALLVDGADVSDEAVPRDGRIVHQVPVEPGQTVRFDVRYRSRGMGEWTYRPVEGAGQIDDFRLTMTTDFADIDFPGYTMSPSSKERTAGGWTLTWAFDRIVTGDGMGMVMPSLVQPGPLAAEMSFSAPISLGLFMLWITVLGLLKGIEVHPINHVFLAAAFFAFHLLFAYTADHLPVEQAFVLSSVVSVGLVVSYLRLVVGPRFALVEAGLAQVLYLVGFSLAHFWDGFTGLTVTVLCIVTLFALMQLTGRIRWAERLAAPQPGATPR